MRQLAGRCALGENTQQRLPAAFEQASTVFDVGVISVIRTPKPVIWLVNWHVAFMSLLVRTIWPEKCITGSILPSQPWLG